MYCWSEKLSSIRWCDKQLNMGKIAVIDWNNYMREVCSEFLTKHSVNKIGGPDKIVESDESFFVKRKNNAGRVLPQQRILGGICRDDNEFFLVQVPNRNAKTLMEKIRDHVSEGSVIYTDCWNDYKTEKLDEAAFHHFRVNHKYNFVDPTSGSHTQKIKRLWGSAKWRNKKRRGTALHHLESYLAEFLFRHHVGHDNVCDALLTAIAELWPPEVSEYRKSRTTYLYIIP